MHTVKCDICGFERTTKWPAHRVHHVCKVKTEPQPPGAGDHLAAILRELSIPKTAGCGCDEMIAKMNQWGPDGCEAHRAEIIAHLQSAYTHATLATKATALGAALWNGYPLTLSGILELAIERSRLATSAGDKP
jgi:hypothetical protein